MVGHGGPRTLGLQAGPCWRGSFDVPRVTRTPSLGCRSALVFGTCPAAVPAPSRHLSLAGHAVE